MANSTVSMPIRDVTKRMHMTVTVKGVKVFTLRVRLAIALIRLAGFVMPFGVTVETE